jgi:hypothetical protein
MSEVHITPETWRPSFVEWTILYRCRRCGVLDDSLRGSESVCRDRVFKALVTDRGSGIGGSGTEDTLAPHACADGGVGLADLVGAARVFPVLRVLGIETSCPSSFDVLGRVCMDAIVAGGMITVEVQGMESAPRGSCVMRWAGNAPEQIGEALKRAIEGKP